MLTWQKAVLLISTICVVVATAAVALRGRTQSATKEEQSATKEEEATPVQEGVRTQQEIEHGKIFSKEYQWRNGRRLSDLSGAQGSSILIGPPNVPSTRNAPPPTIETFFRDIYCHADAIVEGTVKSKTSQLTDDGTFTFTNYQMNVAQVLKDNPRAPILPGSQIEVARPGGAIQLNGRVIRVKDQSYPPLELDTHYLLFLQFIPTTSAYKAFYRGSDFILQGDKFTTLIRASVVPAGFRMGGQSENLLNAIRTAAAVGCNG